MKTFLTILFALCIAVLLAAPVAACPPGFQVQYAPQLQFFAAPAPCQQAFAVQYAPAPVQAFAFAPSYGFGAQAFAGGYGGGFGNSFAVQPFGFRGATLRGAAFPRAAFIRQRRFGFGAVPFGVGGSAASATSGFGGSAAAASGF